MRRQRPHYHVNNHFTRNSFRRSSLSRAVPRTGLQATHEVFDGDVVPAGSMQLVSPALDLSASTVLLLTDLPMASS